MKRSVTKFMALMTLILALTGGGTLSQGATAVQVAPVHPHLLACEPDAPPCI